MDWTVNLDVGRAADRGHAARPPGARRVEREVLEGARAGLARLFLRATQGRAGVVTGARDATGESGPRGHEAADLRACKPEDCVGVTLCTNARALESRFVEQEVA